MILVFVGAGGSAAVDREQYPTTRRFFEKLPDDIKNHPLYPPLCSFLTKQKGGEENIDIEDLIGTLDEFQALHEIIRNSKTFMGWTIQGNNSAGGHTDISHLNSLQDNHVRVLTDTLKRRVYQFYGKIPPMKELETWVLLLRGLQKIDPDIEIFTTNYDRVLEEATQSAGTNIEYGIGPSSNRIDSCLDLSFWTFEKRPFSNGRRGLLTKLHGSVNWQHYNEGILMAPPRPTQHLMNHCILYPGHKGEPTEEPFITFHEHLRNVVQGEKYGELVSALFIGFAFRDQTINRILEELPENIISHIIIEGGERERGEISSRVPFTGTFEVNVKGLTREAVPALLDHISVEVKSRF